MSRTAPTTALSLFLDHNLVSHADLWAFLASVQKIAREKAEEIVRQAEARGRIVGVRLAPVDEGDEAPWFAPPSRRRKEPPLSDQPEVLEIVLGDQIYIPREGLSPGLRNRLLRLAAFQNPEFYKAQAMRLSTHGKSRIIACAEEYPPQHIGLPRGCFSEVMDLLAELRVRTVVRDERFAGMSLLTMPAVSVV